jgi:seryl-tRNA synthetase
MLDPKYFDSNIGELETALKKRNFDASGMAILEKLKELSKKRRELIKKVEDLKGVRNKISQEVGALKAQAKGNPEAAKQADEKILATRQMGDEIKTIDIELGQVQASLDDIAYGIPNVPHSTVPVGKAETDNKEVRKWGEPKKYSFKPKEHVILGESLGVLDFERAGKLSGARFSLYIGAAAALERALIQFMLNLHTREHGYEEVIPPFLVNRATMTGTGQLPKFEADLFKTQVADRELFLIPTSEVPLTNIHADEILQQDSLPKYFTAYSPCFRSEAGSYGKDTRGLIRLHQFQKVELVKIVEPQHSYNELEKMVQNAEKVLQLLGLPYRVILLCSGDMGFGSTKTYDLEVWLPSQNTYREISSCSNCEDFQARRAKIRFKQDGAKGTELVHTLNGSGLAVGRTFVAILENYQLEDGTVWIPPVLHPYLESAPGFVRKGGDLYLVGQKNSAK